MIGATMWGVVAVVAIVCGAITRWVRINAESDRLKGSQNANAELADAVRRLEQRVANLERAVTTAESERKYAL